MFSAHHEQKGEVPSRNGRDLPQNTNPDTSSISAPAARSTISKFPKVGMSGLRGVETRLTVTACSDPLTTSLERHHAHIIGTQA
jgi:hypothetical protein